MNLSFLIAKRYFRSKKSLQAINIISWISISAIAVSTAAMIILFSVFNGLESTVKSMYTSFYPDIKIEVKKGKFFTVSEAQKEKLSALPGIGAISYSLEDMVLLSNEDEQKPATLKGVDNTWFAISGLDSFMLHGTAGWNTGLPYTPVIIGLSTASSLSVDVYNAFSSLNIYYPRPEANFAQNPEALLNRILVKPEGLFHVQEDFDGKYVLIPLTAAQRLFQKKNEISSIEMKTTNGFSESRTRKAISAILGKGFIIANRFQQNKTLYVIMKSEKWAIYAILVLVLLIASFNMIGCLSMLVLEKRKDITILKSMGAGPRVVRLVFLYEGLMLAFAGAAIGIVTGLVVCLGQRYFGWVSLPNGLVITAYPVVFQFADFILVFCTASGIGLLAAWYPARRAALQTVYLREE